MFNIGDKIGEFSKDGSQCFKTGIVTDIMHESETHFGQYEIMLDNGNKMNVSFEDANAWDFVEEEETQFAKMFLTTRGVFTHLWKNRRKIAVWGFCVVVLILLLLAYKTKQGEAEMTEKTQIQIWTEKMASLEIEKASHYERQKYLRSENTKEVQYVKNIDAQINALKDKIHTYITPATNE